jgi:hypothetical protein
MMYAYVSVCRADFGDLLRPECPDLVLDDLAARTRRAKYPVRDDVSRLQRLLLDREALSPQAAPRGVPGRPILAGAQQQDI